MAHDPSDADIPAGDGNGAVSPRPESGPRLWGLIVVMLSGSPCLTLMFAAMGPALPMVSDHFGGGGRGDFIAQMMMTMPAIGVIIGGAVGGYIIQRFGVRRVLFAALFAYAAAGSAGLYVDAAWGLFASRLALGAAVAVYSTCVVVLIAEFFDGAARARLLGFQGTVSGVISLSALIGGGVLAEWGGWRAPFAIYLVTLLLLTVAMVSVPRPQAVAARRSPVGGYKAVLKLWPIYAAIIPLYCAIFMSAVQLSFLLAEQGVSSALSRSYVIAMTSLGSSLGGAVFGVVFARLGLRATAIAFTLFLGLGLMTVGVVSDVWMIAAGCLVAGFGAGMATPYIEGLLLSRADKAARSQALGLMFTSIFIADFLNPIVVTPIRLLIGIHGAFFIAGAAVFVTSIILFVIGRRNSRMAQA